MTSSQHNTRQPIVGEHKYHEDLSYHEPRCFDVRINPSSCQRGGNPFPRPKKASGVYRAGVNDSVLEATERRRSWSGRTRVTGLDKCLHDTHLLLIKGLVELAKLLHLETMTDDHGRVEGARLDLGQKLGPVPLNRRLTGATQGDALLHEGADVELIGEAGVVGHEGDVAKLAHGPDGLVDDLGRVRLEPDGALDGMQDALGVAEGGGVDGAVDAIRLELVQGRHDVLLAGEVDDIAPEPVSDEGQPLRHVVDAHDAPGTLGLAPLRRQQADGAEPPNGHGFALTHLGADDAVVGGRHDVAQI